MNTKIVKTLIKHIRTNVSVYGIAYDLCMEYDDIKEREAIEIENCKIRVLQNRLINLYLFAMKFHLLKIKKLSLVIEHIRTRLSFQYSNIAYN